MKKELNIRKKTYLRLVQKGPIAESKKHFETIEPQEH
ncbi:hypothetical protein AWRI1631_142560 [Saccharomyces cerevisiae AWRI1631]|uniref:Uncharacterized protein n=1 Tax=Saccharomyces cerevisiae (strain AWRI1631) TaxID=545124 RepID=B5VQX7_YEAS6|nr:hypothetical protein AWRI1631_142560 [Saccharomyces cerevisiae AWRI1631]